MEGREGYKKTKLGWIPEDWGIVKLGEIVDVNCESLPEDTSKDYYLKYIDIASISTPGVISSFSEYRFKDAPSRARRIVKKGDVIISTVRPYLKAFALIQSNEDNLVCSTGFAVLRTKSNIFNFYIYHYSLSDFFMNQVNSFLVGSNYPAINSKDVRHLFIPLPPLPEQRQIAAILSTVDEKIAAIDQQLAEMEQLKKGLMRRLLTKGMGHSEFKETKIGKIPIDWEVVKLGYKCDVRDGTHDSPKYVFEGIPFITSKNLSANGLDLVNVNYISKKDHEHFSKRSQVERGDIIFGMIGTVGNPVIVNTNIEFSIKNVALVKFKENNTFNNMFVLIILDSEIVKNQFRKISNGGVQSFVSLGAIRNLYFPLPSLYEQKKIAGILSTADEKLDVLREKKGGYQILKKGLMQKLLTGDIRVKAKGE